MRELKKKKVIVLRNLGYGYKRIATETGVSRDAVRSFLKRSNAECHLANSNKCLYCGGELVVIPHHRRKKFCSDNCRRKWWSANFALMHHKTVQKCSKCGLEFSSDRSRKFCSRECYYKYRFGGGT